MRNRKTHIPVKAKSMFVPIIPKGAYFIPPVVCEILQQQFGENFFLICGTIEKENFYMSKNGAFFAIVETPKSGEKVIKEKSNVVGMIEYASVMKAHSIMEMPEFMAKHKLQGLSFFCNESHKKEIEK